MEPTMSTPNLATVAETAAALKVSTKVIYAMVEKGCIPPGCMIRLGTGPRSRIRFDLEKLMAGLLGR